MRGGGSIGVAFRFRPDFIAIIVPGSIILAAYPPCDSARDVHSPLGGVIIADFIVRHRGGHSPLRRAAENRRNAAGIGAYVVGSAGFIAYAALDLATRRRSHEPLEPLPGHPADRADLGRRIPGTEVAADTAAPDRVGEGGCGR